MTSIIACMPASQLGGVIRRQVPNGSSSEHFENLIQSPAKKTDMPTNSILYLISVNIQYETHMCNKPLSLGVLAYQLPFINCKTNWYNSVIEINVFKHTLYSSRGV